jgi:hypothetical protein
MKKVTPLFVLHSTKEIIKENQGNAEWARTMNWVADPKFNLYKAVGAEDSSLRFFFDLRGWSKIIRRNEHIQGFKANKEGILQRPMEILVGIPFITIDAQNGKILAIKRAKYLSDRWLPSAILNWEEKIVNRFIKQSR